MIPVFPRFKTLTLSDKKAIRSYTRGFEFYSNWSFASLWSWNTESSCNVSDLYGNLVITMEDYTSKESMITFLGMHKPLHTLKSLTAYALDNGLHPTYKLIPLSLIPPSLYLHTGVTIRKDRDNYDYIYDTRQLSLLQGRAYRGKRNFVNRFLNLHAGKHSLQTTASQGDVQNLITRWKRTTRQSSHEVQREITTLLALYQNLHAFTTITPTALYLGSRLIGLSLNEIIDETRAINHHELIDTNHVGASQFLRWQVAQSLLNQGILYINYEQDLGIAGMRTTKKSWKPCEMLKVVSITTS